MGETTSNLAYLVTIICFILALRFLSSPTTARRGNWIGAFGMVVAIVVTIAHHGLHVGWRIPVGGAIGAVFGAVGARRVKMTAMPQMVALFNGVGGGAAALVALAEFHKLTPVPGRIHGDVSLSILLSALIGSISFSGSLVAFAKLQELIQGRPIVYPGQKLVNAAVMSACLALGAAILLGSERSWLLWLMVAGALVFGVLFVLPIGGADMPVVISLLNAFTGLAAAATGFELSNNVLIVSGMLVGASGTMLTLLMGRAMNRSITNVLFGAFGQVAAGTSAGGGAATANGAVRSASADDVAVMLAYAQGRVRSRLRLAVLGARASGGSPTCSKEGDRVSLRDPPGAGACSGIRRVSRGNRARTAERDGRGANPEFSRTDVAVVVGANDVVNPDARNNQSSPIYGMPILNVDDAQAVVVLKRSMNPGFAGIENPLFYNPKTVMLFGDAKESIVKLIQGVKTL
jgi:NAD(P) transhydrogenase subunit beta